MYQEMVQLYHRIQIVDILLTLVRKFSNLANFAQKLRTKNGTTVPLANRGIEITSHQFEEKLATL